MHMDELDDFVEQLQQEGFDAKHDIFSGQEGVLIGPRGSDLRGSPDAKALFFPLWELNDPRNQALVVERRFHEIKERRSPDWKLAR